MNKTIIGIIAAIAILSGIIWFAKIDSQNNNSLPVKSNGTLVAEETNFDFGEISMAAGKVKHSFKIKNIGNESVIINKVYTSCMCTTASLTINNKQFGPYGMAGHGLIPKINQPVKPNEEIIIEAVFDPAAHGPAGAGQIKRIITIENNSEKQIELQFTATVTP
ncbi:DUF1573 domain-containing protein [Candidatus Wolfebacteria bacterium]|nr:DUF1573 domain-containing protein [Candidatus Wolfebacteria bacterium]